ncbi:MULTISPECIES: DUF120 domain-containing protein [Desulfobacula]|uniref:phosphoglycolate phosphatase n=2 Tax=Desulfobacula TaxID=28222 RepID=K0NIU1_DESTT|nr:MULTISPECIES: DUF120 domain-containing protein [Desulfobacula]CCK79738.1 HAD-superfamily hydrolase, subfamily IA, variant 3 [Desulfobacula toluolica Tol2]SDU59596.1 phosphoglycolate phosphatase [Desulfobacula phenolica]
MISGKVIQGAHKAAFFTELDWVKLQCREKIGFVPFPGTLNLELSLSEVERLEKFSEGIWEELVPPDQNFCSSKVLPIWVGNVKGALILPDADVKIHGRQVVEILAPVKLRDELGINDGDMVVLQLGGIIAKPGLKLSVDAVLFDLDGTLIDSIESYYCIVEIILDKMGFPAVPRQTILEAAKNDEFNWDLILPDVPDRSRQETAAQAWQMVQQIYPDTFLKNVRPFPDTGKVLRLLHDRNIKIGIATSTPQKNISDKMKILDREGILNFVETVVSAGDVERKKPFPDALILCRDRLGVRSDRCVYVGDMVMDVVAGMAAGMKTIGVLTGFETYASLAQNNPDVIIESISDLPDVLEI